MKPHSMFLREESVLPSGIDLSQEKFTENEKWISIRDTTAFALDIKVRAAGFIFLGYKMCLIAQQLCDCSFSEKVEEPFNAAEIQLITVKFYLGLWVATVMLITRHIQLG